MLSHDDRVELVVQLVASLVAGTGQQGVNAPAIAAKAWKLLEAIEETNSGSDLSKPEVSIVAQPQKPKPLVYGSSTGYRRAY
ncbi:MAG: hypothetical protein ACRDHZ_10545 [Ktedonobacteraceae bacterium]